MPSPFPGMDPYLENPRLWPGFHDRFIHFIARALNDRLPTGYFADTNERVYVSQPKRSVLPDVAILEALPSRTPTANLRSGTALLETPRPLDAPFMVTLGDFVRETFVEIMSIGDGERVVTAIELLSPGNKTAGEGWNQYTLKQRQTMNSDVHLLEIDLLRQGTSVLIPSPDLLRQYASYDYAISLHRARTGFTFAVWLCTLPQRLPCVSVPLAASDTDVPLDLQTIFERCYEDGPYQYRVDYRLDPTPPLNGADSEWADALLRKKGLRES